ncbi:hypothetical protein [Candidatus Poriferisodalis sp.]|uniref:hypothetical protein n=1 Tax=Candidatus Poriferisodalis sp. TaxID=3101277 RepID=UPI003B51B040
MARKSSKTTRPRPAPPPPPHAERPAERIGAAGGLSAWALGALFLMWFPGGAGFTSAFCGADWDAPCQQRYSAGWIVVAVTIAATLGLSFLFRRRSVVVVAVLCVPAQVCFYVAYAIPTAASIPNLPS